MSTTSPPFAVADLLTLSRAARLIQPRRAGRPTSGSTLFRWAKRGINGVTLRTWRLGRTIVTTEQALRDFILATSSGADQATAGCDRG
jgi:hypothetical protein